VVSETAVRISSGDVELDGDLVVPAHALGIVLFAHGSGSSRHSTRNRAVAAGLQAGHFATLLIDLLTPDEEAVDRHTREVRFDIALLAGRLLAAADWLHGHDATRTLGIGCFGASTGAAAALVAAAERPDLFRAVVSRGGRPDLAGAALPRVAAPTLLIVGGADRAVLELNRQAMGLLECDVRLEIVPGASHLFEEPGTLDTVTLLAREWFSEHLLPRGG
jgi:putative phosphoribosyl transferase